MLSQGGVVGWWGRWWGGRVVLGGGLVMEVGVG